MQLRYKHQKQNHSNFVVTCFSSVQHFFPFAIILACCSGWKWWDILKKKKHNVSWFSLVSCGIYVYLKLECMIFRTRKVSPQTNRGWYLLVSNWKMVELLLITTSKRSRHFTWFWDFGEELWLRWRLWQEKKLRLILNQLIPLIGSRSGLRKKKEFLLFSKGFIFFIFKYYSTWVDYNYTFIYCKFFCSDLHGVDGLAKDQSFLLQPPCD